jgi:hypothetical protein
VVRRIVEQVGDGIRPRDNGEHGIHTAQFGVTQGKTHRRTVVSIHQGEKAGLETTNEDLGKPHQVVLKFQPADLLGFLFLGGPCLAIFLSCCAGHGWPQECDHPYHRRPYGQGFKKAWVEHVVSPPFNGIDKSPQRQKNLLVCYHLVAGRATLHRNQKSHRPGCSALLALEGQLGCGRKINMITDSAINRLAARAGTGYPTGGITIWLLYTRS